VARQPKILIADEPTANLDKLTTEEIIDLLRKINDFGTTILVTTHNENIVNNLQKRVVTLKDGKIVDDQKSHGVYKLDETPLEKSASGRVLQAPGHALKVPAPKPKVEVKEESVVSAKPVAPVATKKIVKTPVQRTKSKTMPRMIVNPATPRKRITKSNVI
jgi:ABC-type methionine transport system ATPase subunit